MTGRGGGRDRKNYRWCNLLFEKGGTERILSWLFALAALMLGKLRLWMAETAGEVVAGAAQERPLPPLHWESRPDV